MANDAHRLGQALCSCDLLAEACQVSVSDIHVLWCRKMVLYNLKGAFVGIMLLMTLSIVDMASK